MVKIKARRRQPFLMKNSANDNAMSLRLIEDDVFTLLKTADTKINPITSPTQTGRVSKPVKTSIKVVFGLFFAPAIYRVIEYLCQIRNTFRSTCSSDASHLPISLGSQTHTSPQLCYDGGPVEERSLQSLGDRYTESLNFGFVLFL
jgi:hypothetical protein